MDEFLVHFCCRHPRGWCGLKLHSPDNCKAKTLSPPAGVVWIEILCAQPVDVKRGASPPARVVWIEIYGWYFYLFVPYVATREGGVD